MKDSKRLPREIDGGPDNRCPGAVDTEREYIYFSYTAVLVRPTFAAGLSARSPDLRAPRLPTSDADRRFTARWN